MPTTTYKDFDDIEIPEFLQDETLWSDDSWGNDITAHSRYNDVLIDRRGNKLDLWVWVSQEEKSARESFGQPLYWVTVYTQEGNEVSSVDCNTDAEAIAAIKKIRLDYGEE